MKTLESIFKTIVLAGLGLLGLITTYTALNITRFTSALMRSQLNTAKTKAFVLVIGLVILGGIIYLINKQIMKSTEKTARICVAITFATVVLLQILFLLFVAKPYPQTDNYIVLSNTMRMAREGKLLINNSSGYFGNYPNNYFIMFFLYGFFRIMLFFKVEQLWNAVIIFNVIMINISILLTLLTVKRIRGVKQTAVTMILIAMCPTTYCWLTFTYTNTLSLPFCMALLYMAICYPMEKKIQVRFPYMLVMGVIASVGFLLRATIVIPIVAVSFYLLFQSNHSNEGKRNVIKSLRVVTVFLICFLLFTKGIKLAEKSCLTDPKETRAFPITHWIMLGLSEHGGYNDEDSNFTYGYPTREEKIDANIRVIKQRLVEVDKIKLLQEKLQRVWGDGTDESLGFSKRDTSAHRLFPYVIGNRNIVCVIYVQAFRILTFLYILLSVIKLVRNKNENEEFLFALTLFGAMLFFVLWEANVKYNISFIWVMIILMQYGVETMGEAKISKTESGKLKVLSVVTGFSLLLFVSNLYLVIQKQDVFTEKKSSFTNTVFNGDYTRNVNFKLQAIENSTLKQTFETKLAFNRITILGKKVNSSAQQATYTMRLIDHENKEVFRNEFTDSDMDTTGKITVQCDVEAKDKEELYQLEIKKTAGAKDTLIFGKVHSADLEYIPSGVLTVGEKQQDGDLHLSISNKENQKYTSKQIYWCVSGVILLLQLSMCIIFALRIYKIRKNNL